MLSAAVLLLQTENLVCVPTLKCVSVSTISRYLVQVDQAEVGHGAAHHPAGAHLRVHAGRGARLTLRLRAVQVLGDRQGDGGEGNDVDSVQGGPGLLLHGARAGLVHV